MEIVCICLYIYVKKRRRRKKEEKKGDSSAMVVDLKWMESLKKEK